MPWLRTWRRAGVCLNWFEQLCACLCECECVCLCLCVCLCVNARLALLCSSLPFSSLVSAVHDYLSKSIAAVPAAAPVEPAAVSTMLQRLAERVPYGVKAKGCILMEDTSAAALWRWEVLNSAAMDAIDFQLVSLERRLLKQVRHALVMEPAFALVTVPAALMLIRLVLS
jgi:hypothetical protein